MLRHSLTSRNASRARGAARILAAAGLLVAALGPVAGPATAVDLPTMEARFLLGGHARVGSWAAIAVHLANGGPAITGELRLAGGTQGQTRFGTVVDLPTGSDKTYVLYVQPPAFGSDLEVALVDGDRKIETTKAKFTIHDPTQMVVAVVAEHPERIVDSLHLPANQNQLAPVVASLAPEDLPDRVEAWGSVDRIVWQDVESSRLTNAQLDALRGWVAGGGRLVIAGGTLGPKALSAFPDVLLPYRPVVTTDAPATSLGGLLGELPTTATTLPALSGHLIDGRALATVADQVVAAERPYGTGIVTLLGFDPGADWIAKTDTADVLWRRVLPARATTGLSFADDSMAVNAVGQLPALALPPIGGLIALLGAYIVLIGPINYFVLRRLDKRELAWFTIPAFIVVFAIGAYGFGAALRGGEVIVNEVAIVRGAPGATDGTAQVYVGVFSPARQTFQVRVPGGALLSAPLNGNAFGNDGSSSPLDVLQGDPARVRDLAVGFGSLRTVRAETAVSVPLIQADLHLTDGRLKGTVTNASTATLEHPAVVLGSTAQVLGDLAPGAVATVDVAILSNQFGQSLSDQIVGQMSFDGPVTAEASSTFVRHQIIDQLSYDPMFGSSNQLPAEGPVVLAWGSDALLPIEIADQTPRFLGNILYYMPTSLRIDGHTTFRSDLIHSTVVKSDASFFNKDPNTLSFGRGSATIAYRPTLFDGTLAASELAIALNPGGEKNPIIGTPSAVQPLASIPPPCPNPPTADCSPISTDGLPEVELFDATTQAWVRLPHLTSGVRYAVADPARYVDRATGGVLVRYVNDRTDGVGFAVDLSITGDIR